MKKVKLDIRFSGYYSDIYNKGLEGEETSEINESASPIKITKNDI